MFNLVQPAVCGTRPAAKYEPNKQTHSTFRAACGKGSNGLNTTIESNVDANISSDENITLFKDKKKQIQFFHIKMTYTK